MRKKPRFTLSNGILCVNLSPWGGLGLKQTHLMNQVLLAKVGWKLLQKDQGH